MITALLTALTATCLDVSIVDIPKTTKVKVIIENIETGDITQFFYEKKELSDKYPEIEKEVLNLNKGCKL